MYIYLKLIVIWSYDHLWSYDLLYICIYNVGLSLTQNQYNIGLRWWDSCLCFILFVFFIYRNPDNDENGPWCFTINGDIIDVDYCGIPHCQGISIFMNIIYWNTTKLLRYINWIVHAPIFKIINTGPAESLEYVFEYVLVPSS